MAKGMAGLKQEFREMFKGTSIESKDKPALINQMVTYYIKEGCSLWEAYVAVMEGRDD